MKWVQQLISPDNTCREIIPKYVFHDFRTEFKVFYSNLDAAN